MTSRFALYTIDRISKRFAADAGVPRGTKPSYNISPAQLVPVIIKRDGVRSIERMIWGFVAPAAKDTNGIFRYKSHIARSEGIFDRPSWATAIRTQRCLIPANGFYEWRQLPSGKTPYYLTPSDTDLFAFAGIYSSWTDPSGETHGICAIITTASGVESVMTPSRLPVIVDPADEADWLNPEITDINTLYKIMRPYEPDLLRVVRVSDAINSPKSNTPELIAPILTQSS